MVKSGGRSKKGVRKPSDKSYFVIGHVKSVRGQISAANFVINMIGERPPIVVVLKLAPGWDLNKYKVRSSFFLLL